MSETQPTLQEVLSVATKLPPPERRTLAKQLLQDAELDEESVVIVLHRLPPSTQSRLDELLAKSNEGTLTEEERIELTDLVAEYEHNMLDNTEALLRASRPDLFDESGRLVRSRLTRAVKHETNLTSS